MKLFCVLASLVLVNVKAASELDYKHQVQITNHHLQALADSGVLAEREVDEIVVELIRSYSKSFLPLALVLIAPENAVYDKDGSYPKFEELIENEKRLQNKIWQKLGHSSEPDLSGIELEVKDWGELGWSRRHITLGSLGRLTDGTSHDCLKRRLFTPQEEAFLIWQIDYKPMQRK